MFLFIYDCIKRNWFTIKAGFFLVESGWTKKRLPRPKSLYCKTHLVSLLLYIPQFFPYTVLQIQGPAPQKSPGLQYPEYLPLFFQICPLLLVFIPVVIAIIAAIVYIMQNPYFSSRFLVAVYPYFNRYGAGYAYCFIRDLLANSKFAGKGTVPAQFGSNVPLILPLTQIIWLLHWHTILGGLHLPVYWLLLYYFLFLGCIMLLNKERLGTLVSLSIMLTFILQAIIYVISNLDMEYFRYYRCRWFLMGKRLW